MRKSNKKGFILVGGEIGLVGLIFVVSVYGAIQTHKGNWGANGTEAVKNCPGTHVNDNCAHMRIEDL